MTKEVRLKILDIQLKQLNRLLRERYLEEGRIKGRYPFMGIPYTLAHTKLELIREKLEDGKEG